MLVLSLALLAFDGGAAATKVVEIEPREASWTELQAVYPKEWMLPEALWAPVDPAAREATLPFALERLASARFEAASDAPAWTRSFGDIVAEARKRGIAREKLESLLAELKLANPAARAACGKLLREVLLDSGLFGEKWKGEKDASDDGLYFGPVLELNQPRSAPWTSIKQLETVHQAAALVYADLEAIKTALNDYPSMRKDPGTSYERIGPTAGTFVVGRDAERGPFAALRISFRSDLPFPFGHYDCDLGVLDMLDARGRMTTYVFAPSKDFYWFAGQDWHHPIRSSDGAFQGILLVRIAGFDLKSVPDGDSDRVAGTRVALGNLKRRAEAALKALGGSPRTLSGAVPRFGVLARSK